MYKLFEEFVAVIESLDPPINHQFLAPALKSDIAAAEAQLGLFFPDQLKSLLLCTNGQVVENHGYFCYRDGATPVFPMLRFAQGELGATCSTWLNGVHAIVDTTNLHRDEYQELKDDGPFEIYGPASYHDHVIGFTFTENSDSLVIDLKPEPGGNVGQVVMVRTQPYQIAVLAPNLSSFLREITDGYRSGRFRYGGIEPFSNDWGEP